MIFSLAFAFALSIVIRLQLNHFKRKPFHSRHLIGANFKQKHLQIMKKKTRRNNGQQVQQRIRCVLIAHFKQ